jgi:hypothetical protein
MKLITMLLSPLLYFQISADEEVEKKRGSSIRLLRCTLTHRGSGGNHMSWSLVYITQHITVPLPLFTLCLSLSHTHTLNHHFTMGNFAANEGLSVFVIVSLSN